MLSTMKNYDSYPIMSKYCKYLYFVVLATLVILTPQHSTSKDSELTELMKKNEKLKARITTLISDTLRLTDSINVYKIWEKKQSVKIEDKEKEYNQILSSLDKDSVEALRREIESLNAGSLTLHQVADSLREKNKSAQNRLEKQKSALYKLAPYNKIKHQRLLALPFDSVKVSDIAILTNSLNELSNLNDFDEYKARVEAFRVNYDIYSKATACINSPYDADTIEAVRANLGPILDAYVSKSEKSILTPRQFDTLDSLDIKLSRYSGAKAMLKEFIDRIHGSKEAQKAAQEGNQAAYKKVVEKIIYAEDENSKYYRQRYLGIIPYIDRLLNQYINQIDQDPFATPNQGEEEIIKLK